MQIHRPLFLWYRNSSSTSTPNLVDVPLAVARAVLIDANVQRDGHRSATAASVLVVIFLLGVSQRQAQTQRANRKADQPRRQDGAHRHGSQARQSLAGCRQLPPPRGERGRAVAVSVRTLPSNPAAAAATASRAPRQAARARSQPGRASPAHCGGNHEEGTGGKSVRRRPATKLRTGEDQSLSRGLCSQGRSTHARGCVCRGVCRGVNDVTTEPKRLAAGHLRLPVAQWPAVRGREGSKYRPRPAMRRARSSRAPRARPRTRLGEASPGALPSTRRPAAGPVVDVGVIAAPLPASPLPLLARDRSAAPRPSSEARRRARHALCRASAAASARPRGGGGGGGACDGAGAHRRRLIPALSTPAPWRFGGCA
eukprot:scaffold218_cov333-Prasinococcus_capsulatus_cf.AAC.6